MLAQLPYLKYFKANLFNYKTLPAPLHSWIFLIATILTILTTLVYARKSTLKIKNTQMSSDPESLNKIIWYQHYMIYEEWK